MVRKNSWANIGNRRLLSLELLLVFLVIAILTSIGVDYYRKPIVDSQTSIIGFHAGVFSRMMSTLNAYGKASPGAKVVVNETAFYLNEKGWPANTDAALSPSIKNQTSLECQQLWRAVFTSPPTSVLSDSGYKEKSDYIISLNKKGICRYELARKQEGTYFFDYDVNNGSVNVGQD